MADELFGSVQKMDDDGIKYSRRSLIVALSLVVGFIIPNKEF